MFTNLNTFLDINSKALPKGKFYLISEGQSDGSFLIHHFLNFYLKGGYKVCFLALSQSFTHYSSVSQKLGTSLSSAQENGNLVFIEGLKLSMEGLNISNKKNEMQKGIENNSFAGLGEHCFCLKPLYERIKYEISKFEDPYLLIIDDLSVLHSIGVSITSLHDFAQYCQACSLEHEKDGCLVILSHHDTEDSEEQILTKHLQYNCDIELSVSGLSTGYSKDVHGQLDIIDHNACKLARRPSSHKTAQYKIMDRNIELFAPGTSSSVL